MICILFGLLQEQQPFFIHWEIYGYTSFGVVEIGMIYAEDGWNIDIEEGVVWTK